MATKAANGEGDGQLTVTEEELRELNYHVGTYLTVSKNATHLRGGLGYRRIGVH